MITKPLSSNALCVCGLCQKGAQPTGPKRRGALGPPWLRLGFSPPSLSQGHMTQLQATHKGFLNSLSWPTLISINA